MHVALPAQYHAPAPKTFLEGKQEPAQGTMSGWRRGEGAGDAEALPGVGAAPTGHPGAVAAAAPRFAAVRTRGVPAAAGPGRPPSRSPEGAGRKRRGSGLVWGTGAASPAEPGQELPCAKNKGRVCSKCSILMD